jgi:hypothetical protein
LIEKVPPGVMNAILPRHRTALVATIEIADAVAVEMRDSARQNTGDGSALIARRECHEVPSRNANAAAGRAFNASVRDRKCGLNGYGED